MFKVKFPCPECVDGYVWDGRNTKTLPGHGEVVSKSLCTFCCGIGVKHITSTAPTDNQGRLRAIHAYHKFLSTSKGAA